MTGISKPSSDVDFRLAPSVVEGEAPTDTLRHLPIPIPSIALPGLCVGRPTSVDEKTVWHVPRAVGLTSIRTGLRKPPTADPSFSLLLVFHVVTSGCKHWLPSPRAVGAVPEFPAQHRQLPNVTWHKACIQNGHAQLRPIKSIEVRECLADIHS